MNLPVFLTIVACLGIALSVIMTGAWLVWYGTKNSGWIDTVWSFGLGGVGGLGALSRFLTSDTVTAREELVALLIAMWSLRLGVHIAQRTRNIADDPRYAALIRGWGVRAPRQMFLLTQKQALVSLPLAVSVVVAAFNPAPGLRLQDWFGVAIMLIGIAGEAIADMQIHAFRADPANRNRLIETGLWRFSRHPNYFFEWFGWLAYPLIAIDLHGGYPWGYAALAAPACMYWLLVHVSGIPPLEEHMLKQRGEAFRDYQKRTNAFFPGPVRSLEKRS